MFYHVADLLQVIKFKVFKYTTIRSGTFLPFVADYNNGFTAFYDASHSQACIQINGYDSTVIRRANGISNSETMNLDVNDELLNWLGNSTLQLVQSRKHGHWRRYSQCRCNKMMIYRFQSDSLRLTDGVPSSLPDCDWSLFSFAFSLSCFFHSGTVPRRKGCSGFCDRAKLLRFLRASMSAFH